MTVDIRATKQHPEIDDYEATSCGNAAEHVSKVLEHSHANCENWMLDQHVSDVFFEKIVYLVNGPVDRSEIYARVVKIVSKLGLTSMIYERECTDNDHVDTLEDQPERLLA